MDSLRREQTTATRQSSKVISAMHRDAEKYARVSFGTVERVLRARPGAASKSRNADACVPRYASDPDIRHVTASKLLGSIRTCGTEY